jgi:hypothetical protein
MSRCSKCGTPSEFTICDKCGAKEQRQVDVAATIIFGRLGGELNLVHKIIIWANAYFTEAMLPPWNGSIKWYAVNKVLGNTIYKILHG